MRVLTAQTRDSLKPAVVVNCTNVSDDDDDTFALEAAKLPGDLLKNDQLDYVATSNLPANSAALSAHSLPSSAHRKPKRSSSASNDQVHERDRFWARHGMLNTTSDVSEDSEAVACEVCLTIQTKTQKLNVGRDSSERSGVKADTNHKYRPAEACGCALLSLEKLLDDLELPLAPGLEFARKLPMAQSDDIFAARILLWEQLESIFRWYLHQPLPPTSSMFPWLHGMHRDNLAQRAYFMAKTEAPFPNLDDPKIPENARFLMCVESEPGSSPHVLRNSEGVSEILKKVEYSRDEVAARVRWQLRDIKDRNLLGADVEKTDGPDTIREQFPDDIIAGDCFATSHMPQFLDLDPDRGVSLRNFHIQVAKVAKCADLVVYCMRDDHLVNCKCMAVLRLLCVAQIGSGLTNYGVYVLENVDTSERLAQEDEHNPVHKKSPDAGLQKPSLQAKDRLEGEDTSCKCHTCPHKYSLESSMISLETKADSISLWTIRDSAAAVAEPNKKTQLSYSSMRQLSTDTFSKWDADFLLKEKIETTCMSAASKLFLNVWLGNIWDHALAIQKLRDGTDDWGPQVNNFSAMSYSALSAAPCQPMISILPKQKAHWRLFVHCHNDAQFPPESILAELLFKYTITSHKVQEGISEYHQLEFPSAGSVGFGDCKHELLMSIVNTCKLLYLYSSSASNRGLASLIYCSDGYTELSLLTLCYIMYAENLPLNEAMSSLHKNYNRPFYIFDSDVGVLRKLEMILRKCSPKALGDLIVWGSPEKLSALKISLILLNRAPKFIPRKLRLGYIHNDSDSDSSASDSENDNPYAEVPSGWVEDVEGLLPSKILPYLYLGSLRHANNLALLLELGIATVISVGEQLDWLSGFQFRKHFQVAAELLHGGAIERFQIKPRALNPTWCLVTQVLKVNNLQDDGIDELSDKLPAMLEVIDQEYVKSGGNSKILVHCRVGVSRSATVVIAEVMRRLNYNLAQAYLYIRVRRLNIVIQPNLRFMYELFKWEELQRVRAGQTPRSIDWFVMCREIKKLNLPFLRN